MAPSTAIDYKIYLEFPNLTKIHGEPTFNSIKTLHNELKTNSQTVPSNLGGGTHGHLGLVLNHQQYALLSNAPFIAPPHPGTLIIPPGTTQHMTNTLKEQHAETLRVFTETQTVEKTLRQQIIAAVEASYLAALRDRQTNSIGLNIAEIIQHLYDTYGNVTPRTLQDYEDRVKGMVFDPIQPIDDVFNAVMDLMDYSEAARAPYSQQQSMNIAYIILSRPGKFGKWILEWNRKPRNQQSWLSFKTHFRNAQKEYRELQDTTVAETEFNQAHMVREIIDGVRNLTVQDADDNEADNFVAQMAKEAVTNCSINKQKSNLIWFRCINKRPAWILRLGNS